jgi:hypothetical protein
MEMLTKNLEELDCVADRWQAKQILPQSCPSTMLSKHTLDQNLWSAKDVINNLYLWLQHHRIVFVGVLLQDLEEFEMKQDYTLHMRLQVTQLVVGHGCSS